jgi:hypothetical protein
MAHGEELVDTCDNCIEPYPSAQVMGPTNRVVYRMLVNAGLEAQPVPIQVPVRQADAA